MDKIKRFIDCAIPTETCNLRCHYCYIAQKRKFNNKLAEFEHSKEEIRRALSFERLGGTCLINFCAGGETLLSDQLLPIAEELIKEGHYIMIVTNGTLTNRFKEIAALKDEIKNHLFLKISFHYLEMVRLNMLDKFFDNVDIIKNAHVSFTVEITPSDELVPYIDDVKDICMQRLGALPHITIARDDRTTGIDVLSKYSFDEYREIWSAFESDLFTFKSEIFYKKRTEFCYAGDWSLYLNLQTGFYSQCCCGEIIGNIYRNISEPIPLKAIGNKCITAHCYNGHAFLTLGDIPELKTPTYAQVRNRVCTDGSEWLTQEMKAFMSTRLYESNREYSVLKKAYINNYDKIDSVIQKAHRIKCKVLHKD